MPRVATVQFDEAAPRGALPQGDRCRKRVLPACELEPVTAIQGPRGLSLGGIDGRRAAVGHYVQASGVDSPFDEVLPGGRRPAVAEGQVVLGRPALIAVAGDANPDGGVGGEDRGLAVEGGPVGS